MLSYIEKLQQRPKSERKRVALLWSACVGGIVFLLWLGSFALARPPTGDATSNVSVVTPVSALKSQLSSILNLFNRAKSGAPLEPTPEASPGSQNQ